VAEVRASQFYGWIVAFGREIKDRKATARGCPTASGPTEAKLADLPTAEKLESPGAEVQSRVGTGKTIGELPWAIIFREEYEITPHRIILPQ